MNIGHPLRLRRKGWGGVTKNQLIQDIHLNKHRAEIYSPTIFDIEPF